MMKSIPKKDLWTGRIDKDPFSLRYHQVVQLHQVDQLPKIGHNKVFSLIGFECDEGVRRNQGRVGAAQAPNEIRKFLSSLPFHQREEKVIDVGNVVCEDRELEKAQQELGTTIRRLLEKQCIPIILGGGHETLYGHYLGIREFLGSKASLGIINIDAHFDLRVDDVPSSGTMFQQILSEDLHAGYLCLGIQKPGNTKALFEEAEKHDCTYILEEDVMDDEHTFGVIDEFCSQYDFIILTLCTDVISSSSAPGVSAPSPYGLDPKTVRSLLRYLVSKEKVMSFDLSEVNPRVDENQRTSRLAALLVADVMEYFNQ